MTQTSVLYEYNDLFLQNWKFYFSFTEIKGFTERY
jgi:hypothetical protein